MPYDIDLQIDPAVQLDVAVSDLREMASAALAALGQSDDVEMAVIVTTDEGIRELNRGFRGIDEPTDVLSFASAEGPAFVLPAGLPPYLGDVIISQPTAERQAAERGGTLRDELALLLVHGCLHLLGHDHVTPEQREAMWALQSSILERLGIAPPQDT